MRKEIVLSWIPCADRPPEKYGEYLVTIRNRETGKVEGSFTDYWKVHGGWHYYEDHPQYDVIAWMSMPAPFEK